MRTLLLALCLVGTGPAAACPQPPGRVEYVIRHEAYGEIGRHVIGFACAGEDLIVETRVHSEVEVLLMPVFRREARYREVWRGDRLLAFESRFEDNGEVFEVRARASGERMVIDGENGRIEAPASVVSNHPWNAAVVLRPLLFDTRSGRLQQVRVTPAGDATISLGGRAVSARKYRVTGDLERELWYDRDGNWLQSRLAYQGKAITLTRR